MTTQEWKDLIARIRNHQSKGMANEDEIVLADRIEQLEREKAALRREIWMDLTYSYTVTKQRMYAEIADLRGKLKSLESGAEYQLLKQENEKVEAEHIRVSEFNRSLYEQVRQLERELAEAKENFTELNHEFGGEHRMYLQCKTELAALKEQSEPVAWRYEVEAGEYIYAEKRYLDETYASRPTPLYTTPQPSAEDAKDADFASRVIAEFGRARSILRGEPFATHDRIRKAINVAMRGSQPSAEDAKDALIERMASNFLGWKLPKDFTPDAGIAFDREYGEKWGMPVGTNLLTIDQARAMFKHCYDAAR